MNQHHANPPKKPVYTTNAYAFTHPYAMGAVAALAGHQPPEPKVVVEWGCGTGWNLIAMAARLPEANFVGVDLDQKAIAIGRDRIAKLGLKNIELRAARFEDPLGISADYQIAHGLYSWISERAQGDLLGRCLNAANTGGLVFLSYNTLPGWAVGDALRPMVRNGPLDPMAAITLLGHSRTTTPTPAQLALTDQFRAVAAAIERQPDYLDHEWLEPNAAASWHMDVISSAAANGLAYCGDTELPLWGTHGLTLEAGLILEAHKADPAVFGTLRDILTMETFRRSVFAALRSVPSVGVPSLYASHALHRLAGNDLHVWAHADGRTVTAPAGSPLDALLTAMTDFPGGIKVRDLADGTVPLPVPVSLDVVCSLLPELALKGLVYFRSAPMFAPADTVQPVCDPFVRQCIELGYPLVSKAHVQATMDASVVDFLKGLDGQPVDEEDQQLTDLLGRTGFLV